jgi:C4-dicarboxylate-specific signal transduction histidine kinase
MIDIGEQNQAETALRERKLPLREVQEKLVSIAETASLSDLSASIAHEMNQPLAAIVATSHACQRWLSADPPNLERAKITLERIIRDANSASEAISLIRANFSQMDKAKSTVDIGRVITEVCRLMANELGMKNARTETDFDQSQLQQVLIELTRNAVKALEARDQV